MSYMSEGIGTIKLNNKTYQGMKLGSKYVKRLIDFKSCTILTINCSENKNVLSISNQENLNAIERIIITASDYSLLYDSSTENSWTLPNGTYKVFIRGEFTAINSTCQIDRVILQDDLTTGFKMFYNCDIANANLNYEIKIPNSMVDTESMFEESNITATVNLNFNTITNCKSMYKNCADLTILYQNQMDVFGNESALAPNLLEENHSECFAGCTNVSCHNPQYLQNGKSEIFEFKDIPESWGGPIADDEEILVARYVTATPKQPQFVPIMRKYNGYTGETISYETDFEVTYKYTLPGATEETVVVYNRDNLDIRINAYAETVSYIGTGDDLVSKYNNIEIFDPTTVSVYCMKSKFKELKYCVFAENPNTNAITSIDYLKLEPVDCQMMFGFLGRVTYINLENLNTSKVKNMNNMFYRCKLLTDADISHFVVNDIEGVSRMFERCEYLTSINMSGWNSTNVTDMRNTFAYCYRITSIDLSNTNFPNVTSLSWTFYQCSKLATLNISNFVLGTLTNLERTFTECKALPQLNLSHWNVNATTLSRTFNCCKSLTLLDLTNWKTDNATTFESTFYECKLLTEIPGVEDFKTNSVKTMRQTFYYCENLTSLDLTGWDTSLVEDMEGTFSGCYNMQSLDLRTWDTRRVFKYNDMFATCRSLTDLRIDNFNTISGSELSFMFVHCELLTDLNQYVSKWNTNNYVKINSMFGYCLSLSELDLSGWNVDNVKTIEGMFSGCESLTKLDLTGWDTTKCENLSRAFADCHSLVDYYIPITFGDTYYYSMYLYIFGFSAVLDPTHSGDCHAKLIYLKGTPSSEAFSHFAGALYNLDVRRYLDISALSDKYVEIVKRYETAILERNWQFVDSGDASRSLNEFLIAANDTNGMTITLFPNITNAITEAVSTTDWGDGTVNTDTTHTYATPGNYIIKTKLQPNNSSTTNTNTMIVGLNHLRNDLTDMSNFFYNCSNLTTINMENASIRNITNMSNAFNSCSSVTELNINGWELNANVAVDNMWDNSSIDQQITAWKGVSPADKNKLNIPDNDTYELICTYETEYPDRLQLVPIMRLTKYADLDGNFTTIDCEEEYKIKMQYTDSSNNLVEQVFDNYNLNLEFDSDRQDISGIGYDEFINASFTGKSLTTVNIYSASSKKENLKFVTFYDCNDINISYLNVAPTICDSMFSSRDIESLDLTNFDSSNIEIAKNMFYDCSIDYYLDLSSWNVSKVKDMSGMFAGTCDITGMNLSGWDTSNVENMSNMFYCSGCWLDDYTLNLSGWDISKVKTMEYMFSECGVVNLDLSHFDTSSLTNANYMFYCCGSLESLDISNFDTTNVTSFYYTFGSCYSLVSLDVSSFDTSNVTDFEGMFDSCECLTNITGLENFDTSNATSLNSMFYYASSLTSLDVSNFNTDNCEDFGYMFNGLSVPSLNLTSFKVDSDDGTSRMFTNTSSNCSIYIDSTKFNKTEADCEFAGTFINGPYPAN